MLRIFYVSVCVGIVLGGLGTFAIKSTCAGDLPRTDAEVARRWPGAPPVEIRPWSEFVTLRRDAEALSSPGEVQAFLVNRLGPLPWRFDADPRSPFRDPLVIERVERMEARGDLGTRFGVWASGRYLGSIGEPARVENFLIGPVVSSYREHVLSPGEEARLSDKYGSPVYRDIGGGPRPLYGYHYGNPALTGPRR